MAFKEKVTKIKNNVVNHIERNRGYYGYIVGCIVMTGLYITTEYLEKREDDRQWDNHEAYLESLDIDGLVALRDRNGKEYNVRPISKELFMNGE